jgi:hypothetical protein
MTLPCAQSVSDALSRGLAGNRLRRFYDNQGNIVHLPIIGRGAAQEPSLHHNSVRPRANRPCAISFRADPVLKHIVPGARTKSVIEVVCWRKQHIIDPNANIERRTVIGRGHRALAVE